MGNNRVVADAQGTAVQETYYYPFGLPYGGGHGAGVQPYKYNGKEFDTMNGLNQYDYHALQQDPVIPSFTTMDPLEEKYYSWSPYVYCGNNPLKYIDPTGMDWYRSKDGTAIMWREGNEKTYTQTYTGEDGNDFTIEYENTGEYYSETVNGTNVMWKQNEVVGVWDSPSFSQKELSGMESWAQSDNLFASFTYNLVNDISVSLQSFFGFAFDYGPENELTGGRGVYNLDGTSNFNMDDSFVNTTVNAFSPFAKGLGTVPKGISIGKLNAAQFSKTFKGNLSRLPAGTRGKINVRMNRGIELINGHVLDPTLVTNLKPYDEKK